ncbi:ethanolamine kinase [Drepanopeziza brunnea f. sp. 'multigermtubi' MB_m1]|uniref:ethanolamine kinase n=1 Tax=Marssonina brunnea f. sp. multigermtubi (strain MB_m1) TaxID=1072389 RepID=K1XTT0_MARBU|nr:ethanolamine kinase [Drepanopeziza brunnea f. sp. 'multigermtubi' MB_m1]EKD15999.1 ethanolamine kinase [Drepanopeziza brunnea f. sp. 'multigermtubi' MB_m1]
MAEPTPSIPDLPMLAITLHPNKPEELMPLMYHIVLLIPDWEKRSGTIEILYKVTRVDKHCTELLVRIYGNSQSVLVDREREIECHQILHQRRLVPPIFARFQNGYIYGFSAGVTCRVTDLHMAPIYRAVARCMAEWHARVPVGGSGLEKPTPNLWSILNKWIMALPAALEEDKERQLSFLAESEFLKAKFADTKLVFSHCDLHAGNVLKREPVLPGTDAAIGFIDFEYAMPAPAAFDIACHFSEWGGYDLDYNFLPNQSMRRAFISEYALAYNKYRDPESSDTIDVTSLCQEVDSFRGLPGLFWGIAALIQAAEANNNMNFKTYGDDRITEYWDWRAEEDGSRAKSGEEMPLRELKWKKVARFHDALES